MPPVLQGSGLQRANTGNQKPAGNKFWEEVENMQIADAIADMLTRIGNASSAKHETVDIPASNIKKDIARILLDEDTSRMSNS